MELNDFSDIHPERVGIVGFEPRYADAFRRLNEEWITAHFEIEPPDIEVLGKPQIYILDRGGFIFIALLDGEPVGACALLNKGSGTYELAKMAVAPAARGQKIGAELGMVAIAKARELGAGRVFLETNTKLRPAIALYQKLGFTEIQGPPTPYARCDLQMELRLTRSRV